MSEHDENPEGEETGTDEEHHGFGILLALPNVEPDETARRCWALSEADGFVMHVLDKYPLPSDPIKTSGSAFGTSIYETQPEHRITLTLRVADWLLGGDR